MTRGSRAGTVLLRLALAAAVVAGSLVWLGALRADAQVIEEQHRQRPTGIVQAGHPCLGRWEGSAIDHPPTSGRSYGVTIEIHQTQGRNCGTIEYTLGCGGVLHDCAVTHDHIEATEEYTHNPPGACAPAGRFAASCTDVMQWEWRDMQSSPEQFSTGTLRRVALAPLPAPRVPRAAAAGGCGCVVAGGEQGRSSNLPLAVLAAAISGLCVLRVRRGAACSRCSALRSGARRRARAA